MIRHQPLAPSAARSPAATLAEGESRADRMVAVAALQISEHGRAAASARSVAAAAGVAPSAVNYNFGGIERLLSTAFEQGAAQTADWLEARRGELRALPRSPEGLVRALEYMVVEWTRAARPLALLYQECLLASPGRGPGAAWTALWRDAWLEVAAMFGQGEIEGRLLHLFFEAEGLYHLSHWSPALETAVLRELADHFGSIWLGAAAGPPIGALALAEQSAGARTDAIAPAAMKIARAAAEVVEGGLGALTHRSVAAQAGVTTGAVTHHFRTIEELVAGAIRGQVLAMAVAPGEDDAPAPQTVEQCRRPEEFFELIRTVVVADVPPSPVLRRRNLFLAAIRRPELAGCGAVIRFAHGGTTRNGLDRVFDIPPEALSLHAGGLSRLLSAIWYAASADPAPEKTRAWLFEEIAARLTRRVAAKLPT